MKIGLSLEATQVLRNTWHSAINHEWYDFLHEHTIYPMVCHGSYTVTDYDVIVLCGGNDMHGIKTWRNNYYPQRDIFERQLIKLALVHSIPVVGICRGSHFINVEMGGTVRLMESPYDNVKIQLPGLEVTCHHTIQIDQLAPGFDILLQDSAGVIELAVNKQTRQLQVGWHPERSVNSHTRSIILNLLGTL